MGLSYVDLYLIHHPRFATPDIPTVWKELENIKADGLAKSAQLPGKVSVVI
jgi:diketogulonate reductase-like aldo/keto reductase